jgi:Nucleotide hydrolase
VVPSLSTHPRGHPKRTSSLRATQRDTTASPGDYLKPGEDEIEGLKKRLDDRLAPPSNSSQFDGTHGIDNDWEIGDCLAQWWRPNFETFMVSFAFFIVLGNEEMDGELKWYDCSTRSSRHISPNQKSVKSCSWFKCLKRVRAICPFVCFALPISPNNPPSPVLPIFLLSLTRTPARTHFPASPRAHEY